MTMAADLTTRLHVAAAHYLVPLDVHLSTVDVRDDGRVRVHVASDECPPTADEAALLRSALHCVVLDEFSDVPIDRLDVHVLVTSADAPTPSSWGLVHAVSIHRLIGEEMSIVGSKLKIR